MGFSIIHCNSSQLQAYDFDQYQYYEGYNYPEYETVSWHQLFRVMLMRLLFVDFSHSAPGSMIVFEFLNCVRADVAALRGASFFMTLMLALLHFRVTMITTTRGIIMTSTMEDMTSTVLATTTTTRPTTHPIITTTNTILRRKSRIKRRRKARSTSISIPTII
jgi:hypothetical protein